MQHGRVLEGQRIFPPSPVRLFPRAKVKIVARLGQGDGIFSKPYWITDLDVRPIPESTGAWAGMGWLGLGNCFGFCHRTDTLGESVETLSSPGRCSKPMPVDLSADLADEIAAVKADMRAAAVSADHLQAEVDSVRALFHSLKAEIDTFRAELGE